MNRDLIQAIDLALGGNWDAAHRIVQDFDTEPSAAWIHAVLHKIEGDATNSRYWYRHAGKLEHFGDDPQTELQAIKAALQAPESG